MSRESSPQLRASRPSAARRRLGMFQQGGEVTSMSTEPASTSPAASRASRRKMSYRPG